MQVCHSVLCEEDIKFISDDGLRALSNLLDISMSHSIQNYLKSNDADPVVKERVQTFLGKSSEQYNVSDMVEQSGAIEICQKLDPRTLSAYEGDYQEAIDKLQFALDNLDKCVAYVEPRNKEDWKVFYTSIDNSALKEKVTYNKEYFYNQHEKPTPTKCRILKSKALTLQICLKGLKYLKYCREKDIPHTVRANF